MIGSEKIDYKNTAFVLVKPPARVISTYIVKNKEAHAELLDKAKEKGYCLYYTSVVKKDGRHVAKMPWILDRNSLNYKPESEPSPSESDTDKLVCPTCGKECTSRSGLTLHLKHCDK